MSVDLKRKLSGEDMESQKSKLKVVDERNLEEKISKLVNAVTAQGTVGNLVLILQDDNENPYVTLQNSVAYLNTNLTVSRVDMDRNEFELKIDGEEYAKGNYNNIQTAKRLLAEQAIEKLQDYCFLIKKRKERVNVTKENLQEPTSSNGKSDIPVGVNSIAHKMMMKMGWTGGGLGANEQGSLDTFVVYENVNRQGLGNHNLMKEITKKLESFSKSSNLMTLVFNSDFTKEERALIHRIARKFNLKSKSKGSESRMLTVSKKLTRLDIVRELLKIGCEDDLYKLQIPRNFLSMWN